VTPPTFPDPPHRIRDSRPWRVVIIGYVAVGILLLAGLGVLVAFFGFGDGRSLIVDSALALGLGAALPGAVINLDGCAYDAMRAGSRLPGHWTCIATIEADGARGTSILQTISPIEKLRHEGAGRVLGQLGIIWPVGTLAARWWNVAILLMIGLGLIGFALIGIFRTAAVRQLSRARSGSIRPVDLLTWQGRPCFAFVDDDGRRRFQQALWARAPLIVDGTRTQGMAIVSSASAVLLGWDLLPLELEESPRAELLARVTEWQRHGQIRARLPTAPDDPPTLSGRLARIEAGLAAGPDAGTLGRLYGSAWRLVWDSDDQAVSDAALRARDRIVQRLGPAASFAALEECRRRYG